MTGEEWLKLLRRHSALSLRTPTSNARDDNSADIISTIILVCRKPVLTENNCYKYPPDRIFNVDETGLSIVQSKIPKVVIRKGKRQTGEITQAERGSLLILICCYSAAVTFVPSKIISPSKTYSTY